MLTITMNPAHQVDGRPYARTMSFPLTLAELFRTVQVHGGQAVFLQPRPGLLLNLAHVERIEEEEGEQAAADEQERVRTADDYRAMVEHGTPLPAVGECPHGYVRGTCSRCAGPAERDEWGSVGP